MHSTTNMKIQFRGNNKSFHQRTSYNNQRSLKQKKRAKDNSINGYYEFEYKDTLMSEQLEAFVKKNMNTRGVINPHLIPKLMNDNNEEKKEEGELVRKLSSSEKIIEKSEREKRKRELNEDKRQINKFGLRATVTTNYGRQAKLMLSLKMILDKNDINSLILIKFKLDEPEFSPLAEDIRREYQPLLNKLDRKIKRENLIEKQMTVLSKFQPPLNQKGFVKLDDFQEQVVRNIDNNISTIVSAPTSSGKSVMSGYVFTKSTNVLVVVPTNILAWQMSSYITSITDISVPLATDGFYTTLNNDLFVEKVNNCNIVVGTANNIIDYLPQLDFNFDWIIFDEIHMIGKEEGASMEHIAKVYAGVPFLALSATIGNIDYLKDWFEQLGNDNVDTVICDKRFFNLQRYLYSNDENELIRLHPFGMIDIDEFEDLSIMDKSLNLTPSDIYDFALKLTSIRDDDEELEDFKPNNYFKEEQRITLDDSNEYFNRLLEKAVDMYHDENETEITEIIESYKYENTIDEETNLINLLFKLKDEDKLPAIIFQPNSVSCMRLIRNFYFDLEQMENEKYPNLFDERMKELQKAEKENKKIEKAIEELERKNSGTNDSSRFERKLSEETSKMITVDNFQKPHDDFIFTKHQNFPDGQIEEWNNELKHFFKGQGDYYHWIVNLLWRGVGLYVKGLPSQYLRLVQQLTANKQLAVVFSDISLVFGVSMPIRSVVVLKDIYTEDNIDPMIYHQMAGRAGRRGLDKEGNVIFAGYSWDRIKELSVSQMPMIEGYNNKIYSIDSAIILSNLCNNPYDWSRLSNNYLIDELNDETIEIRSKYNNEWNFLTEQSKEFHIMAWKMRYDYDFVCVPFLVPLLENQFSKMDPNAEQTQINLFLVLCHFMDLNEYNGDDYLLPVASSKPEVNLEYENLKVVLRNIGINIPEQIDGKMYVTILMNRLVDLRSERLNDEIRNRLINFSIKIKHIQHYVFSLKKVVLTRIFSKLLTRLWWDKHNSSPLIRVNRGYEDNLEEIKEEN